MILQYVDTVLLAVLTGVGVWDVFFAKTHSHLAPPDPGFRHCDECNHFVARYHLADNGRVTCLNCNNEFSMGLRIDR